MFYTMIPRALMNSSLITDITYYLHRIVNTNGAWRQKWQNRQRNKIQAQRFIPQCCDSGKCHVLLAPTKSWSPIRPDTPLPGEKGLGSINSLPNFLSCIVLPPLFGWYLSPFMYYILEIFDVCQVISLSQWRYKGNMWTIAGQVRHSSPLPFLCFTSRAMKSHPTWGWWRWCRFNEQHVEYLVATACPDTPQYIPWIIGGPLCQSLQSCPLFSGDDVPLMNAITESEVLIVHTRGHRVIVRGAWGGQFWCNDETEVWPLYDNK